MNRRAFFAKLFGGCAAVAAAPALASDTQDTLPYAGGVQCGVYVGQEAGLMLWLWRYKHPEAAHGCIGYLEDEHGQCWGFVAGDGGVVQLLDGSCYMRPDLRFDNEVSVVFHVSQDYRGLRTRIA